jgi:hypothetical protein
LVASSSSIFSLALASSNFVSPMAFFAHVAIAGSIEPFSVLPPVTLIPVGGSAP